ncbi:hypothetical protein ACVEU1_004751, partial [Vibrio parahaemolyticus]
GRRTSSFLLLSLVVVIRQCGFKGINQSRHSIDLVLIDKSVAVAKSPTIVVRLWKGGLAGKEGGRTQVVLGC